ncbi:unnamed protein product [Spodoptera exigua]|uniref:Uncharacterized protein n=1 Tax=Spodoptera exigua TaxID=7107 RepID=A0A922SJN4_SPOEX|nr:hypothetical protein HF086_010010 [Spodoptera exigua]CAH0694723.1 unnamed protein product [Spodoptera exigua]
MGKRSKSSNVATQDVSASSKNIKNKRAKIESGDEDAPKPDETNAVIDKKQVKRKNKNKTQNNKGSEINKNKKIIFTEDDDEPVEVDITTNQQKRTKDLVPQENEEDIKDEDIDKFCDELNEEDNEQFESWVKLIEAKLHSNKKKPK